MKSEVRTNINKRSRINNITMKSKVRTNINKRSRINNITMKSKVFKEQTFI
jgi:hypothetical protein